MEKLTIEPTLFCKGCERNTFSLSEYTYKGVQLCEKCEDEFEDKTGYCSLDCCLGGGCDYSC